ncbi:MAG: cupin [Acidisphaera sp.]|nr:cupin [Acidisphaera sp.]
MDAPETFVFADDGGIPNSQLPLLLYRGALPGDAAAIEHAFAANGWTGAWRDGIYPFHHFHSTAHEVLGIAAGSVQAALGGPRGTTLRLQAGDVVVIPAGVGHRNLGDDGRLLVVGAYPGGAAWDVRRGDPAEHAEVLRNIAAVALPDADPLGGPQGALPRLWRTAGARA